MVSREGRGWEGVNMGIGKLPLLGSDGNGSYLDCGDGFLGVDMYENSSNTTCEMCLVYGTEIVAQ